MKGIYVCHGLENYNVGISKWQNQIQNYLVYNTQETQV